MDYGEVNPSVATGEINDGFIDIDETGGRAFYVPDLIKVYSRARRNVPSFPYEGTFDLDPKTGAVTEISAEIDPSVTFGNRVIVCAKAIVKEACVIGSETLVEDKTWLFSNVRIGRKAIVGRKSTLREFVLLDDWVTVGARCDIGRGATIGRKLIVPAKLKVPDGLQITSQSQLELIQFRTDTIK